jgi:hypothetical protein
LALDQVPILQPVLRLSALDVRTFDLGAAPLREHTASNPTDCKGLELHQQQPYGRMSQRWCQALGTKLPDNQSCAVMCFQFPGCLPPPPDVGDLFREHDRQEAMREALEKINDAIIEGMRKKDW